MSVFFAILTAYVAVFREMRAKGDARAVIALYALHALTVLGLAFMTLEAWRAS